MVGDFQVNLFGIELPFFIEERLCAVLREFVTLVRTLCAISRSEVLVGFVAEKLSQVLDDLQIILFGT